MKEIIHVLNSEKSVKWLFWGDSLTYEYWKENEEKTVYWMNDAKHPNRYGHLAFSNLIFHGLGMDKGPYASSKFFTP
ncbi:MAG: hypothetical protein KKE62_00590 [Proteobacteria bacterium]|nr:hypothetical protein [Pseudomonadota bacterium]MBU1389497.1 hypothetical protein [Pseudomonadota bacterium]MBU1541317.1 hypothetical protein [Pseudomonadota bacterium]MBU2481731.1 hypothetical protein [Pseudomonadota bacterium]